MFDALINNNIHQSMASPASVAFGFDEYRRFQISPYSQEIAEEEERVRMRTLQYRQFSARREVLNAPKEDRNLAEHPTLRASLDLVLEQRCTAARVRFGTPFTEDDETSEDNA